MPKQAPSEIGGCRECGYDLRGLQSRICPECGREFNPDDAKTIGPLGKPLGLLARWAVAPAGGLAWVVTSAAFTLLLWHARYPAAVREQSPGYDFIWTCLFILWGARLFAQLWTRARHDAVKLPRRINLRPAVIMLASIMWFAGIVKMEWASEAALRISRPAFARLALSTSGKTLSFADPRWVGVYRITEVSIRPYDPGIVRFDSGEADAHFLLRPEDSSLECSEGGKVVGRWIQLNTMGD